MSSSAPAISHALEELVGHVNRPQRSLLFTHFRLEQGPSSIKYGPSAPRASRDQIDAFIEKRHLLIVRYRPWMNWRWAGTIYISIAGRSTGHPARFRARYLAAGLRCLPCRWPRVLGEESEILLLPSCAAPGGSSLQ